MGAATSVGGVPPRPFLMRGNGGSSGRRKGGVSKSLLLLCAAAHEGRCATSAAGGYISRPITKHPKWFEHFGLDQRPGDAGWVFPGRPPVGALSAQMRGPSPVRNVRFDTRRCPCLQCANTGRSPRTCRTGHRPEARVPELGAVTGGVRLKAAVSATGRMRQKRTFWVNLRQSAEPLRNFPSRLPAVF